MKRMKKLLAIILSVTVAMTMGMALTSTAFAAGTKTIDLTGGKAGHTYTLYQVFTGMYDATTNELTNIQWGSDANDAFKGAYATAAAAAKKVANDNDARATAADLIENEYLGTGTPKTLTADGNVTFTGLEEGYYLIVDTNGNTPPAENDYNSAFIVKVVKDVNGAIKGDMPSSDKEIGDTPGSGKEAAAYDIGDNVPFVLTATTASNTAAYQKYHITFKDKQSAGLDAPASLTVTVLEQEFVVDLDPDAANPAPKTTAEGTKITVTKEAAGSYSFVIKVEFEPTAQDAVYLDAECNSTDITVEYTSKLNSNAVIGENGNTNDFFVTYSNNPEDADGGDEGKTPEDTVKVFTYKTVVDKVDAEGNPLAGAGFTIYKKVDSQTTGAKTGGAIKAGFTDAVRAKADALADNEYYIAKAMTLVGSVTTDNQFEFKGLSDGDYVLVETTVPEGYNAFTAVAFTISSTVTDETDGITELSGDPFTANPGVDGEVEADKKDGTTHSLDSGELYMEIENNSGAELPETGGIGTTIFYILGALLIIGCGVVLVARRRITAK